MKIFPLLKKARKFISNSLWILSENILRLFVGFFVGVYVARYLGPDEFGIYNYCLAILTILTPILKLGLDNILVKEFVNRYHEKIDIIKTGVILKGGMALGLTFILFTVYYVTSSYNLLLISIMSIGYIFQGFEVFGFYYQSIHENKKITQCKLIQLLFSSVLKLAAIHLNCNIIVFVWLYTIDLITLYIALYIFYQVDHAKIKWREVPFSTEKSMKLVRESWPFILSGVAGLIYMRADQIMIKNMLGDSAVGEFSAAVRLSEIIYMIPNMLLLVLFPVITKIFNENKERYIFIVRRLFDLMVVIAWFMIIPISLLSNYIIDLLYGAQYAGAAQILTAHVFCALFVFIGIANSAWVVNEKLGKITLLRTLLAACLNIALNMYLIPKYGAVGAAYATCISQFMASIGLNVLTKSTRPWFYRQIVSLVTFGFGLYKIFYAGKYEKSL